MFRCEVLVASCRGCDVVVAVVVFGEAMDVVLLLLCEVVFERCAATVSWLTASRPACINVSMQPLLRR